MADISTELETIAHGRFGIDIRGAIHDAIDKINKSSGSGGGGVSKGPVGNIKFALTGYDEPMVAGFLNVSTFDACDYAYEATITKRTSATLSKVVNGTHMVLGIVLHTGTVSVAAGWTLVGSSGGIVKDGVKQMIDVYKRELTYSTATLSVTAETNETICLKIIVLNQNENTGATSAYTFDTKGYDVPDDNQDVLWIAHSFTTQNAYTPAFEYQSGSGSTDTQSMAEALLCAFYKPKSTGTGSIVYYSQTVPAEGLEVMKVILT